MNGFSTWKPWEIERLTPLQLLCLMSEDPPDRNVVRSMAELEEAERAMPDWNEAVT